MCPMGLQLLSAMPRRRVGAPPRQFRDAKDLEHEWEGGEREAQISLNQALFCASPLPPPQLPRVPSPYTVKSSRTSEI